MQNILILIILKTLQKSLLIKIAKWQKLLVGFQGRMEFGPRALGNRSILGDSRNPEMQKKMNLKIKYREGFRPFCTICFRRRHKKIF